jgi:hypothetical protein
MFRLGRLLLGIAVAGAAAATVYNYLEQSNKKTDDDFGDDAVQEEGEEPAEAADAEDYTEKFKTVANRTYTTIKESSADAMAKVKEAIGPRGEEVLDVVGETAGKVKDVVVDSAARVKDILQEEENKIEDGIVEEAVAKAMAAENDPVFVGESEASEEIHEDDVNKEAVYEGEENGEAIHEDDHDKEAVYEKEFPEAAKEEEKKEEAPSDATE